MVLVFVIGILAVSPTLIYAGPCDNVVNITNTWLGGWQADLRIPIRTSLTSWSIELGLSSAVSSFEIWVAQYSTTDNKNFNLVNYSWNGVQTAGTTLVVSFLVRFPDAIVPPTTSSVVFNSVNICSSTVTTTTAIPSTTSTTRSSTTTTTIAPTTTKPITTVTTKPTTTTVTTKPTTTTSTTKPTTTSPTSTTTTTKTSTTVTTTKTTVTSTTPKSTAATTTTQAATTTATVKPVTTKYNYSDVLTKSILFYAAERSGKLPANNPITYRWDSALNDKGANGEDLTGGYYDAGDHVKFGFPMAYTVTVLAWSLIEYHNAYIAAGQLSNMRDTVKWGADYFIKAHVAPNQLYGQVGDGDADHAYWGRPEQMTMARPAYYIDTSKPGSDLAGETAAALAATSIAFASVNATYSALCLFHAKQLYVFADQYRATYDSSITQASNFYKSWSGYGDELAWAAAWLYRATNDATYLTAAQNHYSSFGLGNTPDAFSWDSKIAGVQVLLAKLTQQTQYSNAVKSFCDAQLYSKPRTPKGLVFLSGWGSLRYAANSALICLLGADLGVSSTAYRQFSQQQIHYMLGDTGRSFVVGFGTNPPQSPHHRSSSCPSMPASCGWNEYNAAGPNPQVLYGALVGGPDSNDAYTDSRSDYQKNEVACDYNAGFQAAVAGLYSLALKGIIV